MSGLNLTGGSNPLFSAKTIKNPFWDFFNFFERRRSKANLFALREDSKKVFYIFSKRSGEKIEREMAKTIEKFR